MRATAIAALLLLGVPPIAAASAWIDPLLTELAQAERTWSDHRPASYSYTLHVQEGPFGFTAVRVNVIRGSCRAESRHVSGRTHGRWKACPCDGFRMEDVFSVLRAELAKQPSTFSADYDVTYGFVRQASGIPPGQVEDSDWSYTTTSFRADT
jgi:hypothetical protein